MDAVGYGQLEREDLGQRYRIEARYELSPVVGLRFSSNIDATTAFCPGVTRAFLRIDDDAVNAQLRYKCAEVDDWSALTTTTSQFTVGEAVLARRRVRSGQEGHIAQPLSRQQRRAVSPTPERQAAFATFDCSASS